MGLEDRLLMAPVLTRDALVGHLAAQREGGARVVFTNGCFDVVHAGHVHYLAAARALGDLLVVGMNSDGSVRRLKGPRRPICPEGDRAAVIAGLRSVDYVVVFEEDTPLDLVNAVKPDVLVKGGDWPLATIVGREVVEAAGGRVLTIPLVEGRSTTGIVERILAGQGQPDVER